MSDTMFTVKSAAQMEVIAKAIAHTDPVAADAYRQAYEVRRGLENAARDVELGVKQYN